MNRIWNFSAGPATLPLPALERAKDELTNWAGAGMSVMECSHRSKEYDAVHHNTMSLFKEVVFRYTTEQAILDGFLVDYEAVRIKSNVRMRGVFLKPGEHVGIIDTETGQETYDELEDEREFATQDIEQKITAPASNR